MKDKNISLLEGRKVAQAIDYLVDAFKSDVFPKDIMLDILIIMRKMAMNGSMTYSNMQELLGIIDGSLEKLTCPDNVQIIPDSNSLRIEKKTDPFESNKEKDNRVLAGKKVKDDDERKVKTNFFDEECFKNKQPTKIRLYAGHDGKHVCEVESRLSFEINRETSMGAFLELVSSDCRSQNKFNFDEDLRDYISRLKSWLSDGPMPVGKIILLEKEKAFSISDPEQIFGLTFMAGSSSLILVWTKDHRIIPWKNPEKVRLVDLMSDNEVELEQLRCILFAKYPLEDRMVIDFVRFNK